MNSARARERADGLQARLRQRLEALDAERQLSSTPPVVAGGALIVPAGLLSSLRGASAESDRQRGRQHAVAERAAVAAVLAAERALGRNATEMPTGTGGFEIESKDARGNLLFITVKCRPYTGGTVTIARSEIGVARNKPDQHILALVETMDTDRSEVRYLRHAFQDVADPAFDTASVSLRWNPLFEKARMPS